MADDLRFPDTPPEFEVWTYLWSGLDMAREQLADSFAALLDREPRLGRRERELLDRWGELAFSGLTQLMLDATAKDKEFEEVRRVHGVPGAQPWLAFAVDLKFAEEGVGRAEMALERYHELRCARLPPGLSPRSRRYVAEASHTFLFGFDAACIAFCGAAVEQEVKDACVRGGLYTEHALRRAERAGRTGMTFLNEAKRAGLIDGAFHAAETVLRARNEVLHRSIEKGDPLADKALEYLVTMSQVFQELDAKTPRKPAKG